MIVPLMDDGRPYFEVDGNTIKINREGVYRLGPGPASEFTSGHVVEVSDDGADTVTLLNDLFDPEPCRLDHDGDCHQHGWFNSDRPCPMARVRRHFGWPTEHNPFVLTDECPSTQQAFQFVARVGESETVHLDSRTVTLPSDTRTQVAGPDGPYPAVWVTQRTGKAVQVRLDRSAGQHGPIVEVWAYGDGDTRPPGHGGCVPEDVARVMREVIADLKRDLDKQAQTLKRVGEFMHGQSDRVEVHARRLPDDGSSAYYALCDIMVKLRETARDECGVTYSRTSTQDEPMRHHGVPWPLREWALLARQTMEQQALQLADIKAGHGVPPATVERVRAHAVKMMTEVVADYPEDLDAVQAEQATRNADDEAVRRLAHAMTEVANQLDTVADWEHTDPAAEQEMGRAARKLRDTVNTWTTEDQRRPWAKAMSGEPDAWDEPMINPITGEGLERVGAVRGPIAFAAPASMSEGYDTVPAPARVPDTEVHELLNKAHQAIGSAVQDLDSLARNVAPHLADWVRNITVRLTSYPVSDQFPKPPNPEAEDLARTAHTAAGALERTYRPGRPPYVVARVIEGLRTASAPWISSAEEAAEAEPVIAGCGHGIREHVADGCRRCDCAQRREDFPQEFALGTWCNHALQAVRLKLDRAGQADPLETTAAPGPREDIDAADLPSPLLNTLNELLSLLERAPGTWPMHDAARAAVLRFRLREFLGLDK